MKPFILAMTLACTLALSACDSPEAVSATPSPVVAAADAADTVQAPRFTVKKVGAGPDIILVPGLASHPDVFATTVTQLQDRYTLHLVHVSGFAGAPSAGNAAQDDVLKPLGRDLATYASSLDNRPVIIGHSLGGLAALIAGLDAPENIDRIMVIDVLPFFSLLIDPDATSTSIRPTADYLKAVLLAQTKDVFAARQGEALQALTKSDTARDLSLGWTIQTDRSVMANAMHDVLVTDLRGQMDALRVPLTVLYGRDDAIPNMSRVASQFQTTYAPVPTVQIRPVDGALHFIMYDQSDLFAAEVEAFLFDAIKN